MRNTAKVKKRKYKTKKQTKSYASAVHTQHVGKDSPLIETLIFVLPFTKEIIRDADAKQRIFNECCDEIMELIKPEHRFYTTVGKSFVEVKQRRLHAIKAFAPIEAENEILTIRIKGIHVRDRTLYPLKQNSDYPRRVNIKLNNIPRSSLKGEVETCLNLPEGIQTEAELVHGTTKTGNFTVHDGTATLAVRLRDEKQEKIMREWSINAFHAPILIKNKKVQAHAPALVSCRFCENAQKPHIGHHESWCLDKPKTAYENSPDSVNDLNMIYNDDKDDDFAQPGNSLNSTRE